MQYFSALKKSVGETDGIIFTYDSTFGLDEHAERLPAELYFQYLRARWTMFRKFRRQVLPA